jgi:hypothetical protein
VRCLGDTVCFDSDFSALDWDSRGSFYYPLQAEGFLAGQFGSFVNLQSGVEGVLGELGVVEKPPSMQHKHM